jgi:phosphatidylethanolamine/phosphatidyl-N-methylethanolamine N-methyltransferase
MDNNRNLTTYRIWAPVYDFVMRPVYGRARRLAVGLLNLQAGEKLFIPGVGTGLDLPLIPTGVQVTGIDLTHSMLEKARLKARGSLVTLAVMNAQELEFESDSFDALILNLILSVVPDGAAAFKEAWRVLRPGGRAVIFDKFLPESGKLTPLRNLLGSLIRIIGTDPNRRLSDIIHGVHGISVEREEPSLLNGQYRIVLLRKTG